MTYVVADSQYRKIDGQILDLKRRLNQKDGSPIDPDEVSRGLQWIAEGKPFGVTTSEVSVSPNVTSRFSGYNGLLPAVDTQDANLRQWNEMANLGFGNKVFAALADHPAPVARGRLVSVVDFFCLETLQATVESYCALMDIIFKEKYRRSENFLTDVNHLSLIPGSRWPGRGLHRQVVNFGSNFDKLRGISPESARGVESSPHMSIFAAVCHSFWSDEKLGRVRVPAAVWVPGLQATVFKDQPWGDVPFLENDSKGGAIKIGVAAKESAACGWAVPVIQYYRF